MHGSTNLDGFSLVDDLMNLKGKLHQSRLVFSSALHKRHEQKLHNYIYNTTKYTINMIQENIQYNNKSIHDTTKTANDNTTIKM